MSAQIFDSEEGTLAFLEFIQSSDTFPASQTLNLNCLRLTSLELSFFFQNPESPCKRLKNQSLLPAPLSAPLFSSQNYFLFLKCSSAA